MSEFNEDMFFEEMETSFNPEEILAIAADAEEMGDVFKESEDGLLYAMHETVTKRLDKMNETVIQKTEEGRELHSHLLALELEIGIREKGDV